MVSKKTWILVGIYFILGSFIGYFTSIRAEFSYNVYRMFDYAVPIIILLLFCAILAKTQKEVWKNGIASGVGIALGHDIYFGVSSYLELGRNKEYLVQGLEQAVVTMVGVVVIVWFMYKMKTIFMNNKRKNRKQ